MKLQKISTYNAINLVLTNKKADWKSFRLALAIKIQLSNSLQIGSQSGKTCQTSNVAKCS